MRRFIPIFIMLVIIIAIIFIFFEKNYNIEKIGNNTSKIKNLETYISKISSYEAIAEIQITSNKTFNIYKVKQKEANGINFEQEVIEPETVAGSRFIYDGNNLTLENTKLDINKIYENYQYIASNQLSLLSFLRDYKESESSSFIENDTEAVMEVVTKNENKYIAKKVLKIDKSTNLPKSLEVHDNTQNILVYILYNEIKIKEEPEEILAFKDKSITIEI